MPDLRTGERTTVTLQVGGALSLGAAIGATGSIVRLAASAGGEPFAPVVYDGTAAVFGPYDEIARFAIRCDTGVLNYSVTVPTVSATNAYARPYKKTVTSGQPSSVYVPAGSALTLNGTGYVTDGTAIYTVNDERLTIDASDKLRIFKVFAGRLG